ncbi:alpha-glucosidase [Paenibacillus chitinolyticus]|uniref:Alpha-glucosidase n=1 Tax=Paenibacillus chitinolyticus TaxID=79263 RepID=A0A410X2R2_9BACL|nr:alpha-glucosidase [Paenibacillus chitinolyticus]MCY9593833.1 alpha-glucosidase [Paenibacillus chitinolyticus]MCY9599338.1 alpha-glucosidase [Paenibacillus chitinolyticus]QAV20903.1 alpha-glucosidase [Paenibacillus chitinolyticus]
MNKTWWKESVVYQIYPSSFKDSDGDGRGDLRGIISKLDYLAELGVNVIWLCPVYLSPGADNGYDISDYYAIDPQYGTMEDFDELLLEARKRGLKIMMDLVLNHTSDRHAWFKESRSSRDNPKRDYYIWRKGKEGLFPNNWESYFSGSVWEHDTETDEYYMHLYSKHQPDLNWENEEMVEELFRMVHWWLGKGVDGFRFDAIAHIVKAQGLPDADNPQHLPVVQAYQLFSNLEKVHTLLHKLNDRVLFNYDIMTVGETSGLGPEQALDYVGDERHELNMVFQFEHMNLDAASPGTGKWVSKPWTLLELKNVMSRWQTVLHDKGWNANYLGNHDQPRPVSRFGNDGPFRVESAKMLATFLLTLEGTPYIFQGEEIGMTNVAFDLIDDYRDVETINYYKQAKLLGKPQDEVMKAIWKKSRDNARTPMQWDDTANAGFTTGEPWIKVNPNYPGINAAAATADPQSIYHYYRSLIALRKKHPVIVYGEYKLLLPLDTEIYAYTRALNGEKLLVILNFFDGTPEFTWPEEPGRGKDAELLISNYDPVPGEDTGVIKLRPYEARVYLLG